jgi:probable F420-dependent oxidoreductase
MSLLYHEAGAVDIPIPLRPDARVKIGMVLRTMGPASSRETLRACALTAEEAGIDELWVPDHVAIPPDDAEGSGGRYLDPLATLAYLAGVTSRIGLGTGVLILPYRPPLATAKWIATIQELSAGRLLLGVGAGWMPAEFRAVGVPRHRRGAITDETLSFLHACFAQDEVVANGQPFLFLPRPERPPIFIGGSGRHALERSLRFGEGWLPMAMSPEQIAEPVARLRALARDAGKPEPEIVVMTGLPLDTPAATRDAVAAWADAGATRVLHGSRYGGPDEFRAAADALAALVG